MVWPLICSVNVLGMDSPNPVECRLTSTVKKRSNSLPTGTGSNPLALLEKRIVPLSDIDTSEFPSEQLLFLACRNEKRAAAAMTYIYSQAPDAKLEFGGYDQASFSSMEAFAEKYRERRVWIG